jgi:histidinol-phosphate aminotransferase
LSDASSRPPFRAALARLGPFRAPPTERDFDRPASPRRMNLNEPAIAPSPRVREAIAAATLHRYPDPLARDLACALAARAGVATDRIVLGNGSDELIVLAAAATLEPGASAVLPAPAFPRYFATALAAGAEPRAVPLRADGANDVAALLGAVDAATRLVWCASPNNPTGALLEATGLARLAQAVPPETLLALDEAYFEFGRAAGAADALAVLADRRAPWIVLRTFSKAYGLAGLRVGYAIASSAAVAEALNRVRSAFNVSAVAQAAALAALEDEAYMRASVDRCIAERERLRERLAARGMACLPSAANFLAVAVGRPGPEAVAALAGRGLLVAPVGPAPFDRHVRVTIGTPADNDAAFDALCRL